MSPYFSKISIAYSEHLVSQFLHFLILYIPKKLLSFFSKDIQRKMRSGYESSNNNEKVDALILILKNVWSFFIFPITIICETEARLLSRFSFMAAGIHFTGFKDNEPS